MKKILLIFLISLFFVSGCGQQEQITGEVVKDDKQTDNQIEVENQKYTDEEIINAVKKFPNNPEYNVDKGLEKAIDWYKRNL